MTGLSAPEVSQACVKGRSWAGPKHLWSALPVGGSGVSRGSWPATSHRSNEPQTQVCRRYREVPGGTGRYLPVTGKSGFGWLSGRPSRRSFANRICDWGLLREAYAASFYEQNLRCGVHKACVKGRSWAGPKRRWSALPVGGSGVSRGSWPATFQPRNEPQTQACGRSLVRHL